MQKKAKQQVLSYAYHAAPFSLALAAPCLQADAVTSYRLVPAWRRLPPRRWERRWVQDSLGSAHQFHGQISAAHLVVAVVVHDAGQQAFFAHVFAHVFANVVAHVFAHVIAFALITIFAHVFAHVLVFAIIFVFAFALAVVLCLASANSTNGDDGHGRYKA